MDAVLASCHGVRMATNPREVVQLLRSGVRDVAMAIVDLDFHPHGRSLLHVLEGCEVDFPILAVTDDKAAMLKDEMISDISVDYLLKPVRHTDLRQKITELCRKSEIIHERRSFPYLGWNASSIGIPAEAASFAA